MPRTTNYDPLRINSKGRYLIKLGERMHGSPYLNSEFEEPKCSRCGYTLVCPHFKKDAKQGDCPPYRSAITDGATTLLDNLKIEVNGLSISYARRFGYWNFHAEMAKITMNRTAGVFVQVEDGNPLSGMKLSRMAEGVLSLEKSMDAVVDALKRTTPPKEEEAPAKFVDVLVSDLEKRGQRGAHSRTDPEV